MTGGEQENWQAALATGDSSSALRRYLMLEHRDEATTEAIEALSAMRELLRAKRWARARRRLEALENPPAVAPWSLLVEQIGVLERSSRLLDQRDPEAALELLEQIDQPLLGAEANTQRGTALIFMDEAEAAAAAFAAALDNDPKHYRALTNRGNLALEQGNDGRAIADYEAALKINADFANALHNLGVAYRRQGQVGKSVQAIRRAQRARRHEDREDARDSLRRIGHGKGRAWLKYALYAVIALALFFFLRAQGIV